jgi:hypothetical protein
LTKFFGDGVKRAMITYSYRRNLRDDGYCDDCLRIDFDPAKVDVHHLIYTVIPRYIEAFDAYLVKYYDEQFVNLAYEERAEEGRITFTAKSKEYVNPRFKVEQVWPVSFYDELLCRRAFNLTPAEVMERLKGKVEHARLMHNGVYLVGTSQVLPLDDAQKALPRDEGRVAPLTRERGLERICSATRSGHITQRIGPTLPLSRNGKKALPVICRQASASLSLLRHMHVACGLTQRAACQRQRIPNLSNCTCFHQSSRTYTWNC